jgi:PAS domain S-box-containing protein
MPVVPPLHSDPLESFPIDRRLLDEFPCMIWLDDAGGRLVYANRASSDFTGREFSEDAGHGWLEAVHPSDRESYVAAYRVARHAKRPFEVEFRLRRHDGEYRRMLDRGQPLLGENGELLGYVGFCLDTTDRRLIEAARREMEEQVRLLGLATRDWVWSWDAQTDSLVHNGTFTDVLGAAPASREDALEWWRQRVHPADSDRVLCEFSEACEAGAADVTSEYRFRKQDGSYAHVEDRTCFVRSPSGEVLRVLGAMRDISARKRAEAAHARFAKILESTSDFVGMTSAGGLILYVNAAGRELLEWPEEKTIAGVHISAIHPAWAAEIVFEEGVPSAIRDGTWTGETALRAVSGREIPVSQVIISHRNPHGELEFISTIIRDISERKRAEVARIEWANRYDAAIRASGQVLFDWNSTTDEVTYGGDLEKLVGYSAAQMGGGIARLRQIIHPEDVPAFDEEVYRVTVTRDAFRASFRVQHAQGSLVHIEAKGYFFIDRLGQIGRMVGFLADVTAQRQAEAELALAQEGLEARVAQRTAELARANAVIQERALQTETVAQLGQRALSGAALAELLGDAALLVRQTLRVDFVSILELLPDGAELLCIAEAGWPDPEPGRVDMTSQSGYTLRVGQPVISENLKTETRFTPSIHMTSVRASSAVSVVIESEGKPFGVLIAITRIQRAFAQDDVNFLQSMANVLTAAIDRKRAEEKIRAAQEQAESANRAKSEFLSRMSHELRTPLNAILGFTQLLEIEPLNPDQSESVSHISRAGQHLLALINEVLDIARIESGRLALAPEPIELGPMISEVVQELHGLAQRHHIDLRIDASCHASGVLADFQRLRQVLVNLVSNGIKFNHAGGSVSISCARHENRCRIQVADTGPGISPEKIPLLFMPFERLGADVKGIEGTGLGLAFSQRILAALGGELGVTSTIGEGSVFWVDLPCPPATETSSSPAGPVSPRAAAATHEQRVHKVLYVEDQDLNIRLVERILLSRPGYQLITAMRGRLAIDLAREFRPDVILLDLNLPDISGDEVLRAVKQDAELRATPVIMVSADAMGDRIETLLGLGATGYLTKPYKLQEFFAVIESALRISG